MQTNLFVPMRSCDAEDKYDTSELARLNAAPWQVALLQANPDFCAWGPHEDYMMNEGEGWDSRVMKATWDEFGPWELDNLNECVNFYFELRRKRERCIYCNGNGYHSDAQALVHSFYTHNGLSGWGLSITQDEVDALIREKRLDNGVTAEQVNNACLLNGPHDAINRAILLSARLSRMGIPEKCPSCEGFGSIFTEPSAHVALVLWWLHPRKGCSRGIEIECIEQKDLPAVRAFLREAAARNAARFAGVDLIEG